MKYFIFAHLREVIWNARHSLRVFANLRSGLNFIILILSRFIRFMTLMNRAGVIRGEIARCPCAAAAAVRAGLSRLLRRIGTVHRLSTNIVVPDSGRAHAAGEPRRFFTFLFPPRGKRGRRPVTSESKHVTLPKGIASTKKHDLTGARKDGEGYRDRL